MPLNIFLTLQLGVIFLVLAYAQVTPTLNTTFQEAYPQELVELGRIEGKSFFYEDYFNGIWRSALWYCESRNMELASIESSAQLNFLVVALRNRNVSGDIWTSGTDRSLPSGYHWANNGNPVRAAEIMNVYSYVEDVGARCLRLVIASQPGTNHYFEDRYCQSKVKGVLCQTVTK